MPEIRGIRVERLPGKQINGLFSSAPGPSILLRIWNRAGSNGSLKPALKALDFSIGHRGAALQFPEHTRESYVAAARMGAGILECDVTFTKDRELVCRHS